MNLQISRVRILHESAILKKGFHRFNVACLFIIRDCDAGAVDMVKACRKAGLKTAVASSADRAKVSF